MMGDDTASIRADTLIKREPEWWNRYFVQPALESAAKQHRFSIRKLLENARDKDFTGVDGNTVKLSNNLAPCLARRLIRDYPSVKPYIETRKSKYDDLGNYGSQEETTLQTASETR